METVFAVEADKFAPRPAAGEVDLAFKDDEAVRIGAGAQSALVHEAAGVDRGHRAEALGHLPDGEAAPAVLCRQRAGREHADQHHQGEEEKYDAETS